MDRKYRILIIDFTNYEDYPIGGYLTFAKNLMVSFGTDLALAGITSSKQEPVGEWFKKEINGLTYDFFAMARYKKSKTRHFIPDRLVSYFLLSSYCNRIFKIGIDNVFLQRQELMIALASKASNICYCFGGLENPLSISKYEYARYFSRLFEELFFRKLRFAKIILARGDDKSIGEMVERSNGRVSANAIVKFPTRININIFRPLDKIELRARLGISSLTTIIVTTGRLAHFKGWRFMIDCFSLFEKQLPDSQFYFIGEGEDFEKIKAYISANNLTDKVFLKGKKMQEEVALFLNASDLFIMGSYKEGWSTALIEALACGVPSVVTDFGSAREIIENGVNGFIINDHDSGLFVKAMFEALNIPRPVKNNDVTRFSSDRLKEDLLRYWSLI